LLFGVKLSCNQVVIKGTITLKHLGQARSKGTTPLFLVFKQNLTPSIRASRALRIIRNGIKLRKLWPPKVEGVKTPKNKPLNVTKTSSQTPKKSLYVVLLILEFKDDL